MVLPALERSKVVLGEFKLKRVDFSARTVISPDPNLKITVGLQLIAGMTYPEKVNNTIYTIT